MTITIRRREILAAFGSAAIAWPHAARAQMLPLPIVGFINGRTANGGARQAAAFREGLSEAGYAEGRNVTVEYHWLEGHYERLPALLADLVGRRVAVIATPGSTPASVAARAVTTTIPIVFGVTENPVALGLVVSLAHPAGNATGVNFFADEVNAKRLGLMHELLPKAARFGVLVNPGATDIEATSKALKEAARVQGSETVFFNASTSAEIDTAFADIARERCDALFITPDAFLASRGVQIAMLAARARIPASFSTREMVAAGLLMSYGTSIEGMFRQVGIYTGSILKGIKPADLPVLQPTKFEFVVNLKAARALNLDISPMLLARADEVIE
jgi:ABC-type uncharacterized transport system substrate-binding protein